ncbi:MAG: universal stress protein [Nitriliruptorales bacterium]|nr:universal stress protein [Nitriliruptorales bacterium]
MVGLDGSDSAQLALGWAVREASTRDAQLEVITVTSQRQLVGSVEGASWPTAGELELAAQQLQDRALSQYVLDDVEVVRAHEYGHPAGVLVEASRSADLLVVGSRGLGQVSGLVLGSVSHQVVAHASCVVVVVPDNAPAVERIVVGVDGSPPSLRALRWAWDEARLHDAHLEAVSVYRATAPILVGAPLVPQASGPSSSQLHESARRDLDDALELAVPKPEDVERTVLEGPASARLLDRAHDADLLVVGSRGLGGFKGLLLGSVSQRCVTHAPHPVAIVR